MINIEDHIPWVLKVATPFARSHRIPVRDSEFFADGCVGLAMAAENFDATLGHEFLTYAHHFVRGEILNGIRRRRTTKRTPEGRVVKSTCGSLCMELETDSGPSVSQSVVRNEEIGRLREAIELLSPSERKIIDMRLAGLTLQEIGDQNGYSRQRAEFVLKSAMATLRVHCFTELK